ncbi:MAG: hypothetical protein IJW59_04565 [Clostridia bacterium]|nr:hypothetical protein [Clostridia bacterium]
MEIAIICLNQNLNKTHTQQIIVEKLKDELLKIGEQVSLISYFDFTLNSLSKIITSNIYDLIYIVGTNSTSYNSSVKQSISQTLNQSFDINADCRKSIIEYCKNNNISFSIQEEAETYLPSNSIPLTSSEYQIVGFVNQFNNSKIVFLPGNLSFINTFINKIIPNSSVSIFDENKKFCFKCYGILEKDIRMVLTEELSNTNITIRIISKRLDSAIFVEFIEDTPHNREYIASICEKLKKFIYATDNISLSELISELLKIQKKTISIAETITMGNLVKNLSKKSNQAILDVYLFTNPNSINRTFKNVNCENYSVNLVYELDNLLLEKSGSDIAIFVLGSQNDNQCYIAIGDIDGIHVYKNNINTFDDELVDILTDTTMFYLIKKLRQNDLQFS